MNEQAQHIVSFVKETVQTCRFGGIVIGISGGIDSDQDLDAEDPGLVKRVKDILSAAQNRKLKNLSPDGGSIFPL